MIADQKLLELSDFEDLVGETFVFSLDGVDQTVEGTLQKADYIQSGTAPGVERKPFALEFKFPAGTDLAQSLYQIETAGGRKFPPMFLVPVAGEEDGWYMSTSFN